VGSAALPHLRLLGVLAGGLLAAIVLSLAFFSWPSSGPGGPDANGVIALTIQLEPGHRDADDVDETDDVDGAGAIVDIPEQSGALVIAADVGDRFAARFDDGDGPGVWIKLEHQLDEAPDLTEDERALAGESMGEGPQQTRLALPPLLIDPAARQLELVRLSGDGGDPVVAFVPTDPPEPTQPQVAGKRQLAEGALATAQGQPAIVARSGWTGRGWASNNAGCGNGPWYSDNIQALVIHHTVSSNNYGADQVDDMLRAILYAHVDINGWCDIGYNFVVDRFGTIWEGRSGGIDRPVIGGHAKGFNTSAVGVALLGQHQAGASPTPARPTSPAEAAVTSLATWKLGRHGVDPNGTTWLKNRSTSGAHRHTPGQWHLVPTVVGHRDLGLTACPGNLALDFVRDLGRRVTQSGVETVPYRFEAWNPFPHGPGFALVAADGTFTVAGSASIAGIGVARSEISGVVPAPSPGAIAIAARSGSQGRGVDGYALYRDGVVRPLGDAPPVADRPAGGRTAVDIGISESTGGWVMTADGAVIGFGGQPDRPVGAGSASTVVGGDLNRAGDGYLVESTGQLRPVGSAPAHQIGPQVVNAVDVAVRRTGDSGWVVTDQGQLLPFGGAPPAAITAPGGFRAGLTVSAVVAADDGVGGWVLSSDGQLWPFGRERLVFPLVTDAANRDAADVALVGSLFPSEFANSRTARYLNRVSQLFQGRPASPAELEYWDGRLTYEGGGHHPIALELAQSETWAGRRIAAMYRDVLGREPDGAGSAYWLDQVRNGMRLDEVGIYFYGSDEYVAASGSPPAYVERLYQRLLGRGSDADGLAYWVRALESGRARPQDLAAGFYLSAESRGQRVRELYLTVLEREPDPNGAAYWVQRLAEVDDVVMAAELASSHESFELAQRSN
jgi:hypothetical protein